MKPAALGALLRGDIENAVLAASPGGIERQEADGQRSLAAHADRLPVDGTIAKRYGGEDREHRQQWEAVGFVFGEPLKGQDKIFVACTFPKGWTLKPTDHSMWSDVLDDKGRKRASVFFKAAFYDYDAHTFGLESRYRIEGEYGKDGKARKLTAYVAKDTTGEVLHSIPSPEDASYAGQDKIREQVAAWLDANLPDWKNPMAYWDANA